MLDVSLSYELWDIHPNICQWGTGICTPYLFTDQTDSIEQNGNIYDLYAYLYTYRDYIIIREGQILSIWTRILEMTM